MPRGATAEPRKVLKTINIPIFLFAYVADIRATKITKSAILLREAPGLLEKT
jgi:hypothetical protein